jgi:hypothetical protein
MRAQIGRFLGIEMVGVYPDRRPCALCGGRFSVIDSSNQDFGPITAQPGTVVAHHERGELDGAKEVDGG